MTRKTKTSIRTKMLGGVALLLASVGVSAMPAPILSAEAQAQGIPAFLPRIDAVAPGEPSVIDGVWMIRELDKRIVIADGRAFAVDQWMHAAVLRVEPEMVVLQNLTQNDLGVFSADDLPLMGRATMTLQDDGSIVAQVPSLIPVTYHLDPLDVFYPDYFVAEIDAVGQFYAEESLPGQPGPANGLIGNVFDHAREAVANAQQSDPANPIQPVRPLPPVEPLPAIGDWQQDDRQAGSGNPGSVPSERGYTAQVSSSEAAAANQGMGTFGTVATVGALGAGAYYVSGGAANTARTVGTAGRAAQAANAARAGTALTQQGLQAQVLRNAGVHGTARIVANADAAQAARGRISQGQLARQINQGGGSVANMNRAGRTAQAARAGSTAANAGRLARVGRMARGATVVGGAVLVGQETVTALTGAEFESALATGAAYLEALRSDDPNALAELRQRRREHHQENFRRIGETFTERGRLRENVGDYTGMELVSMEDTAQRYGEAVASDTPVRDILGVAGERAVHHLENTGRAVSRVSCGIGNIFRREENDKEC
ncbi:hypothetical protein [Aurantiacibacter odishensis]|uniref:hypothetical protein n=1 Tax=Aurantiacibacter odishensis TaxID=1155476 RepID=UPI000E706EC5|nr:hypothetical protein [Aurantiacibacter odishensis]